MTIYYVGAGGSNVAAGTSYATRWLTITKALGAAGIASGDTVYIAPGTYRETITVAMTSATGTTNVIGDVDGSHTTGAAGEVVLTAYTTNDTTAPSATATLVLAGRDWLAFSNITFIGGSSTPQLLNATTADSLHITFTDCTFLASTAFNVGSMSISVTQTANWLFDRCRIFCKSILPTLATNGSADYDADIVFRNSLIIVPTVAIDIASSGALTFKGGGVKVQNCTIIGTSPVIRTTGTSLSTTSPCTVDNSIIIASGTVLSAGASGQITESFNILAGTTPRTNVTAGTGSTSDGSRAPMFELGQAIVRNGLLRPFLTPLAGAPMLGFGNAASPPAVDLLNRVRPSGAASTTNSVGALERHDYGVRETVTIDTGGLAVSLTGPGDHRFLIPVTSGVACTVALKVRYDTNHGTTNPPQAQLVANNAVGYAGQTVTATTTTGSFVALTFTQFTATATGYVEMRLINRSAAGNGIAIYDTVTIT